MYTFAVVAADTKHAAFQQLQGYITTLQKSFSSTGKVHANRTRSSPAQHLHSNDITKRSYSTKRILDMIERLASTSAVRSWKSLSGQELDQKFTSLGLVLDREEEPPWTHPHSYAALECTLLRLARLSQFSGREGWEALRNINGYGQMPAPGSHTARQIYIPGRLGLCTPANTRKDPSRKTRLTKWYT
jgi:hypothetical protein